MFIIKKVLLGLLLVTGIFSLGGLSAQAAELTSAQPLNKVFTDNVFATEIARQLNKATTDQIVQGDLNKITYVNLSGKYASSIEGLQYLNNLVAFHASEKSGKITSLKPLNHNGIIGDGDDWKPAKLQNFQMRFQQIKDVTPFIAVKESRPDIWNFSLYGNKLDETSIPGLMELPSAGQMFDIGKNNFVDFSWVKKANFWNRQWNYWENQDEGMTNQVVDETAIVILVNKGSYNTIYRQNISKDMSGMSMPAQNISNSGTAMPIGPTAAMVKWSEEVLVNERPAYVTYEFNAKETQFGVKNNAPYMYGGTVSIPVIYVE